MSTRKCLGIATTLFIVGGLTGRLSSDQNGRAITFVTLQQGGELTNIEKRINTVLPEYKVDNFEAFRTRERPKRSIRRFGATDE